jgi:hypothetical protein
MKLLKTLKKYQKLIKYAVQCAEEFRERQKIPERILS